MLFMSYVYFSIWQIRKSHVDKYNQASIFIAGRQLSENDLINLTSPFSLSKINERTIFRMLRLIGCEPADLEPFQRLVNDRNEIAHSNGNIFYNDPREKFRNAFCLNNRIYSITCALGLMNMP